MALVGAARRLGVTAKAREVRGADRVVIRDGEAIGALLTRMGAQDTRLTWEERRMRREVRATANRLANFDDANLRRSARAAVAAAARVERALEILGDEVPGPPRRGGPVARSQHRQASLEELGQLADPPMTKDAVAGRIRRLLSMADKQGEEPTAFLTPNRRSPPTCSTTADALAGVGEPRLGAPSTGDVQPTESDRACLRPRPTTRLITAADGPTMAQHIHS